MQEMFSHRDDVSLANPFGPPAHGWERVAATMELAASTRREGRFLGFETLAKYATTDLAYVVELERLEAKLLGMHRASLDGIMMVGVKDGPQGGYALCQRRTRLSCSAISRRSGIRET
jgi:hypothetical protein